MDSGRVEQLLTFYREMLRIRLFEEKILDVMLPGRMFRGSSHLSIGQEAVAVGVVSALQPRDYLITSHRGHGHCLARGMDPERAFAEIMGRSTGVCAGKGGSMHLSARDLGILGENPVVGSSAPMAAGAALALRMQGSDGVVACFFGEGAINTGAFHEAVNMAALWSLPVVFVCENNRYAISVPVDVASAHAKAIHERALGYGIEGHQVDGMNVMDVYDISVEAIDKARREGRPSFLVFDTYRFVGHHTADSEHYRPKDEVLQEFRAHDPIHFVERSVADDCIVDMTELVRIRDAVRAEVDEAFSRASRASWPSPEEALDGVYVETTASFTCTGLPASLTPAPKELPG